MRPHQTGYHRGLRRVATGGTVAIVIEGLPGVPIAKLVGRRGGWGAIKGARTMTGCCRIRRFFGLVVTVVLMAAQVIAVTRDISLKCPAMAAADPLGFETGERMENVVVRDVHAYVADAYGLTTWDVSDPAHPVQIGHWLAPSPGRDVALGPGSLVLLAAGDAGLFVPDLSDPARPHRIGSFATAGSAYRICLAGNNVFVAETKNGLEIVDISDPVAPRLAGRYLSSGVCSVVAVSGDIAYLSCNGLQIFDVSDPANLIQLGEYPRGMFDRLVFSGGLLYGLVDAWGLKILDVSDPANVTQLGYYDPPGDTFGMFVSGDIV